MSNRAILLSQPPSHATQQVRRNNIVVMAPPPMPRRAKLRVIAIHCSGSSSQQWGKLRQTLAAVYGPDCDFTAIDLYGTAARGHWSGMRPFALDDEVQPIIAAIDAAPGPVHLIGHSYGGAVALQAALRRRRRVASLALYEPCAFHVLKQMGPRGTAALKEIRAVARQASEGVLSGDHAGGAAAFIDYWSGGSVYKKMSEEMKTAVVNWFPKLPLEFRASIGTRTPMRAYRYLDCPVLVMRGERTLTPPKLIAERLARLVPHGRLVVVPQAGHMGPLSHADSVNALMRQHVDMCERLAKAA